MQARGGQRLRETPPTHHKMASPLRDVAGRWGMWIPEVGARQSGSAVGLHRA